MLRSDGSKALPPEGKGAPGASRNDFPTHAGGLGPHRAHAGRDVCSPGSPRRRATPSQPSSPPRQEGAPRLPPLGAEDATTTRRIGVPRPNHQVRKPSAGPYDGRRSRLGSGAPTTITKYSGETRPELWLADYRLACQLGGTDDDNLIICNLPLFLSDAAWAWLEHLPPAQISNWDDLVRAFAGNF
jgi:hypothetical protein